MAYLLEVTGGVVMAAPVRPGSNGDPVCKHRAQWYFNAGLLSLDDDTPEPDPPALGATMDCPDCNGCGVHYSRDLERLGLLYPTCRGCGGTGTVADTDPSVGSVAGGRGKRMSNEQTGASRETLLTPHAYIQISHTDRTFSEVSVNLEPAFGPHDVEDALAECSTPREVLAYLLDFVEDEQLEARQEIPTQPERVSLTDDKDVLSLRLLHEALDDTDLASNEGPSDTDPET